MLSPTETTVPAEIKNPARMWQTAGYYTAFIILGLTSASFGPALTFLADQTHTQLNQISALFAFRYLGYLLGSLRGGWLYDHRPGHPILTVVLIALAMTMALVPAIPLLIPLVIVLFGIGLCEGVIDVGGNTLLIWAHGPKVGPFMNGLHFFFGIGSFLAPIFIAQAVLLTNSYSAAFWLIALLMLPLALILSRVPSPAHRPAQSSTDERTFSRRLVVLLVIFFFLYVGAEVSFGGWVFTYTTRLNLADVAIASYITSAFWGALTAGRLLGIPISTRLSPKSILWIDLIGCGISMLIIVVFPGVQAALWIGTMGLGFSMASVFPTTLTFAEKRLHISGKITSWFFIGASMGGMVLPWVIGQVFDPFGPPVAMVLILGDVLLTILLFFFIK